MKPKILFASACVCATLCAVAVPMPGAAQLHTLEQEIVAIVHFGLNTFTGMEWGYGNTPADVFAPARLDASQWVAAARDAGVKRIILVCKHHDGFCLWPSPLNTAYSVAATSWRGGNGDLVREVADVVRAAGLEFGAYLSPWDRHHADYAHPAYTEYFHAQWRELMERYGPLCEIWVDSANGGTGWYGGADERRNIADYDAYYDYPALVREVARHNPLAVFFGLTRYGNVSMRWPGNERGSVPEDFNLAESGVFLPPEADVPLRGKWFWHPDDRPKSLHELADCYLASVGRSGILNLGLAPDRDGLIDKNDVRTLAAFGEWVRAFNAFDAAVEETKVFDCVDLREDISKGLRVKAWRVMADGREIASGGQIGFRRIVKTGRIVAHNVQVLFEAEGRTTVVLALRRLPEIVEPVQTME
ncbi:MAG: alpha-L-fucosidase [Kiritimatiellae bacterium]|nr:alpha-L-fucosidase [Kiritimatiellia bacterium]